MSQPIKKYSDVPDIYWIKEKAGRAYMFVIQHKPDDPSAVPARIWTEPNESTGVDVNIDVNIEANQVHGMAVINTANSYFDLLQFLQEHPRRYRHLDGRWRMLGILFVKPGDDAFKQIFDQLQYYNFRSSDSIDLFLVGYQNFPWKPNDQSSFSAEKFDLFRKGLENASEWRYSGGTELLLTNVKRSHGEAVSLEFSSSLVINIDELLDTKSFAGVGYFFEHLFRRADLGDRTREFSDNYLRERVPREIFRRVLEWLPLSSGKSLKEVSNFAVRNISQVTQGRP